jgi:hypothetical protein
LLYNHISHKEYDNALIDINKMDSIELIAAYAKSGHIDKAKGLVTVYRKNKKLNQENIDYILIAYPQLTK